MTIRAFIALGTNMPFGSLAGPALLGAATRALAERLAVLATSRVWRSPAWPPGANQPDYYNAVLAADSAGWAPEALYETLRSVEGTFGRERRERWAARTLDLDLLAMDEFVGPFADLRLPHPRLHERAFVLAPLAEIAPDWRHPVNGLKVTEMLAALSDDARGSCRIAE